MLNANDVRSLCCKYQLQQFTCVIPARWSSIMCIQRECRITRHREVIHSKSLQNLACLNLRRYSPCRPNFRETVRNEEDEDDQEAVGGSFDLEVAEEGVGTEEVQCFIYDIGLIWIRYFPVNQMRLSNGSEITHLDLQHPSSPS